MKTKLYIVLAVACISVLPNIFAMEQTSDLSPKEEILLQKSRRIREKTKGSISTQLIIDAYRTRKSRLVNHDTYYDEENDKIDRIDRFCLFEVQDLSREKDRRYIKLCAALNYYKNKSAQDALKLADDVTYNEKFKH